jgi:hypothetical protein
VSAADERERRRRRIGPIVMLLPLLSVVVALMWMHDRRPAPGPRAEPPLAAEVRDVDGWGGVLELLDGVRVVASVTRLHADPERQRFDAAALGARLARVWPEIAEGGPGAARDGEPWRLRLQLVAPTGPSSERATGRVDGRHDDPASAFALERLLVTDARGLALATPPRRDVAPDAVADPLLALLAPPRAVLGVGETLDLFLWGRAPGADAALIGLADPAPGSAATAPLALVRRPVSSAAHAGSRARLERDAGGGR